MWHSRPMRRRNNLSIDDLPVGTLDVDGGPGVPLLLIHGFTGSKEDFATVVEPLAGDRRVVAVDLPGHGDSEGPGDPAAFTLGPMSTWVLRFADALGFDEFHLLGHSMGGLIAQRTASFASQRLRSLTLMGTGMGALRDELSDLVGMLAVVAREGGMAAAWAAMQEHNRSQGQQHVADDVRAAFIERRFQAQNPAALIGGARILIGAAPLQAFLRGIDIPVLVVHGADDDRWLPSEQANLARTIAGAEYVVIPDALHSPQLENTDVWLKVVTEFLDRAER